MTKQMEWIVKTRHLYQIIFFVLFTFWITATAYAFLGGARWSGTIEASAEKVVWEYRVIPLSLDARITDGSFEKELNELGNDGWELEALVTNQTGGYYVMKKPRS